MAQHYMKYGDREFSVELGSGLIAAELHSNTVALPAKSALEHINDALDNPIGSPRLEEMLKPGQTVCIVVPDSTRLWQSPNVFVPAVVARLSKCGIRDADIRILTATGTHRPMSREEHIAIVSEDIYNRIGVVDHKCRESADMVKAGVTSHGTGVWFNRIALESDHIILTGGVVYHFLAGYGGGPKYLLPGIASYETIQRHHNLALNKGFGSGSNAAVRSANMESSNIFHTDLEEAALLAKPSFLLNVVVDDNYNIIKAVAGDMVQAHREACALVDAIDGVNVAERTPLVIASAGGAPKDINFYQTIKTLANALAVVSEGGTIIILSACTEGFGSPDTERRFAILTIWKRAKKTCARIFPSAAMWVFCSRNLRKSTTSSWSVLWLRRSLPKQRSILSQPWTTLLRWQKSSTAAKTCARHCCLTGPIPCPNFRRPITRAVLR